MCISTVLHLFLVFSVSTGISLLSHIFSLGYFAQVAIIKKLLEAETPLIKHSNLSIFMNISLEAARGWGTGVLSIGRP